MKITIDTDKGILIAPASLLADVEKKNEALKSAGVDESKFVSARKIILDYVEEALKRPILTPKQAKEWNADLENQMAK